MRQSQAGIPRGAGFKVMPFLRATGLVGVTLFLWPQPLWAAPFAANCRYDYDTSDRVSSYTSALSGNEVPYTNPGQHVHWKMRLDIDVGKGTVVKSGSSGDAQWGDAQWDNGKLTKISNGRSEKDFVVSNGRFVWFGEDYYNDDGSFDYTYKNRLDLDSGLLDDWNGTEWQCEKAVNEFQ